VIGGRHIRRDSAAGGVIEIVPPHISAIETRRLRGLVLHPSSDLRGGVTMLDVGAHRATTIMGRFELASAAPANVPVVFDPNDDPGIHQVVAFVSQPSGLPRKAIVLTTYQAPPPTQPSPPTLTQIRRFRGTVTLTLAPGNVPLDNAQAAIVVTVTCANRQREVRRLTRRDLRAVGAGEFAVRLGHLDPKGRIDVVLTSVFRGVSGRVVTHVLR
jgi:hypothetical protein